MAGRARPANRFGQDLGAGCGGLSHGIAIRLSGAHGVADRLGCRSAVGGGRCVRTREKAREGSRRSGLRGAGRASGRGRGGQSPATAGRRGRTAARREAASRGYATGVRLGTDADTTDHSLLDRRSGGFAAAVSRLRCVGSHETGSRWIARPAQPDPARRGSSVRTVSADPARRPTDWQGRGTNRSSLCDTGHRGEAPLRPDVTRLRQSRSEAPA